MDKNLNRRDFLAGSTAALAAASALPMLGNAALAADDPGSLAGIASEAMQNLQQGWYNAVVSGLGLDSNVFQLFQTGSPLLTKNSNDLWRICNAIPPLSVTHQFNPSQFNQLFEDYNGVISSLTIPGLDDFQAALGGTNYQAWLNYKQAHKDKILNATNPQKAQAALYQGWATVYLTPDLARTTQSMLESINADPLGRALDAIQLNGPDAGDEPSFNVKIKDVIKKMQAGPSVNVSYDSASSSSDISHTWANAEVSGFLGFFSGGASGSFDKLSKTASSSRVTVQANFTGVTPIPVAAGGWFNSAVLGNAFRSKDDPKVWNPSKNINWDKTFGKDGNMQRMATTLRIASGYSARITSYASYSKDDQQTIQAQADAGVWPFFSASASGGSETKTSIGANGELIVDISLPQTKQIPFVIGVDVTPMGAVLGQ
jgi:hypothetical protein